MPIYPYSFQLPPLNVQDIPNDGAPGEFLGISAGGVLDWLPVATGGGDMLKSENLSGLASYPTARTNLGLGTGDSPTFANLTLTSPSLSSSAPVTISQTWGTTGTFTAFKVVATETLGANANSNLLELWSGSTPALKFRVDKGGDIYAKNITSSGNFVLTSGAGWIQGYLNGLFLDSTAIIANQGAYIGFAAVNNSASNGADVKLLRDGAANTLALRNGAAAQTFNVYGTSSASNANYARLALTCGLDGNATISTQALGTGTAGTVSINGVPVGRGKTNEVNSVAVGTGTLTAVTSGAYNAALGLNALQADTAGSFNAAFGVASLGSNTTGTSNAAFGYGALYGNTSGENNVGVGVAAGSLLANGVTSNVNSGTSVFLGVNTKAEAASQTNQIVIGYNATGIGSNSVVLGNDSITKTALKGNVGIGTTAPGAKLDILTSTAFDGIKVTNSHTSSAAFLSLINNTGNDANFGCYSSGKGDGFANNAGFGAKNSVIINADGGVVSGGSNSIQFRAGGYAANQERMRITSAGNVGIGTTSPSSRLQVTGGDVEIETVTSGIIMKAAGTSTRYRITLNAGGTALVFTAI